MPKELVLLEFSVSAANSLKPQPTTSGLCVFAVQQSGNSSLEK